MKTEERFRGGKDHRDLTITQQTYAQIKQLLGYQIKNEYYLALPNEEYHPLALLLALSPTKNLTKKIKAALSSLEAGQKAHLESTFFHENDKHMEFIIPDQFEQCEGKFNYNISLFQKYAKKFDFNLLGQLIADFSEEYRIRKFQDKVSQSMKSSKKQCKNQDVLLIKKGEQMIIACFSDQESHAQHERVMHHQDQTVEEQRNLGEDVRNWEQQRQEGEQENQDSFQDEVEPASQKKELLFFIFCVVILGLVLTVTVNVVALDFIAEAIPNVHILQTMISLLGGSKK